MLEEIAAKLAEKQRVLLLQGPMSPFFWRLSKKLQQQGKAVFKINFNGGDCLFYPKDATRYRGRLTEWKEFLSRFVQEHDIDCILLYGDCRQIHLPVRELNKEIGIEFGVFEEGYIRPNYITFEFGGVNGFSSLPKDPAFYRQFEPIKLSEINAMPMKVAFCRVVGFVIGYYLLSMLARPYFRYYRHHRPLNLMEGFYAVRGYWRKLYYKIKERGLQKQLTEKYHKQFFFVPLQVYNDSQVLVHSPYSDVEDFIVAVVSNFAQNAPKGKQLVFKHHPRDRGWRDYSRLIQSLAEKYQIANKVYYIHDQHLPSLLKSASGCVTINSTVGLSALYHGCPVKLCGMAVYNIEGLTNSISLGRFFSTEINVDNVALQGFFSGIIKKSQIIGNFMR